MSKKKAPMESMHQTHQTLTFACVIHIKNKQKKHIDFSFGHAEYYPFHPTSVTVLFISIGEAAKTIGPEVLFTSSPIQLKKST